MIPILYSGNVVCGCVQTCLLSAFVLSPSLELFKMLESCCNDVHEWPSLYPESPGRDIDSEKYAQLLDAVNLLRDVPRYRTTPAGWQSLRPVLVKHFEVMAGSFRTAENRYLRTMTRKSVRCGLHGGKYGAKGSQSVSTVSKHGKSSDTKRNLHVSLSGDGSGTVDNKDEDGHTQMHTESAVAADSTEQTADGVDVTAVAEDDAASDITIVTSDVDISELCIQSAEEAVQEVKTDVVERTPSPSVKHLTVTDTEDRSSLSVSLSLEEYSPSNTAVSVYDTTADVTVEQDSLEIENVACDACPSAFSDNLVKPEDVIPSDLHSEIDVVGEECVKHDMNAIDTQQSREMLDLVESQMDVEKSSENEAVTTNVIDEYSISGVQPATDESCLQFQTPANEFEALSSLPSLTENINIEDNTHFDVQPVDKDFLESETVANECKTSFSLPSSTQNVDTIDYDQMQHAQEDVNTADISASLNITSSLSCREESVTLSDHSVDERTIAMQMVQLQPLLMQTVAENSSSESSPKMLMETGQEFQARTKDGSESGTGDTRETNAAETPMTHNAGSEKSTEHSVIVTAAVASDSVNSPSSFQSETTITSQMKDTAGTVDEKAMVPFTRSQPDSSMSRAVVLTDDTPDVLLSRCFVSLQRISVSDAGQKPPDAVSADSCSKLQRRCSVVLERLSPSLEPSTQSATKSSVHSNLRADDDDHVSVIVISSSDDDDDDDLPVKSAYDLVLKPLNDDNQCCSVPDQTTASIYTLSQECVRHSVLEEMSVIDIGESRDNEAVMHRGERNETAAEAVDISSANVNPSDTVDAKDDGKIAADEAQSASAESHVVTDETGHGAVTICIVGHTEDSEDNKQEIPVDVSAVNATNVIRDIQLSEAAEKNKLYSDNVSENSRRTELHSDTLELADLVTWHPLMLNLYSDMATEIISDKELAKDSEEDVAKVTCGLDSGDELDSSSEVRPKDDEGLVEDAVSCDAAESVSVASAHSISSPRTSTNVSLIPSLLFTARASASAVLPTVLSTENGSLDTAGDNAISSDVSESMAVVSMDVQLWAKEDTEDDTVTASVSEESTTLCRDVTEAVMAEALNGELSSLSAIFGSEVNSGNHSGEDVGTSCSDVADIVTVKATDDKVSILADESTLTADAVHVVTHEQTGHIGSVDTIESQCVPTSFSNVQTSQIEQFENDPHTDEQISRDENDNSDVLVCDPFPIFTECTPLSGSVDNLTQSTKLQDNTKRSTDRQNIDTYAGICGVEIKDAYSLLLQPDVPEASDEIYLCTTAGSTQPSSEGQSELDYEGDLDTDTKSHISGQSATDTAIQETAVIASDPDVNVDDDVSRSINQTLSSDSVTAADNIIGLSSEQLQVANINHDDVKALSTASLAVSATEADTIKSEFSQSSAVCSLQDTERCEVQKETQDLEAKEQLDHSEVDFTQVAVCKESIATMNRDVSACSVLDNHTEELVLSKQRRAAYHENTQTVRREVTRENLTMSAMLDKLGALCKNVRQKGQSQSSDSPTKEDPHSVTDKPECERSVPLQNSVSANTSDASRSYCCPYCSLTFVSYPHYFSHLRAENAREKSTRENVEKPAMNAPQGSDSSALSQEIQLKTVGLPQPVSVKSRRNTPMSSAASTSRSRKRSFSTPQGSNSAASPKANSDTSEFSTPMSSKSRRSLPTSSAVSTSSSRKCSFSAPQGSNSAATLERKSDTSEFLTPMTSKSRRKLLKSVYKGSASASTGRSNKRKLTVHQSSTVGDLTDGTENQQSQHDNVHSSQPVADSSCHSLPKASQPPRRSQKSALKNSDNSAQIQKGKQTTEKSSCHIPVKSRRTLSKSVCVDNEAASTDGSQKPSVPQGSDSSVGNQQTKQAIESSSHCVSSKSRHSVSKSDSSTSKPKSRSRHSVPCVERDNRVTKTPAAPKRSSSASRAHAKKNKP